VICPLPDSLEGCPGRKRRHWNRVSSTARASSRALLDQEVFSRRRITILGIVAVLTALVVLMLSTVNAVPAPAPVQQVEITKAASDPTPRVGEFLTFTLRFRNVSTETLQTRVTDPNPAPAYLEILPSTIQGGATYSQAIDGVVWEGALAHSPAAWVAVSYQVQVTSIPTAGLAAGFLITNTATTVDLQNPGVPAGEAEATVRVLPWRVFLPLVGRDCCPGSATVASPFALEIAALHQIQGQGLALTVDPLTEAEWLALYDEAFPTLVEALEESGAGWARVRINWSWIQPDPPPAGYVWGPYHDEKLRLVAETGVQLIASVEHAPDWAADSPCAPIYSDRLGDFAQFLTDLVNRYEEPPWSIKHWELVNEPDGTWPNLWQGGLGCWGYDGDQYAQMLAVAYPAIKGADPGATVLMGGVAHDWFTEYGGPFYRYFPDDVMEAGGGSYVDVLSFHYFPDFRAEWERWDPDSYERQMGWLPAPTCGDLFDGQGTAYEARGVDLIAKTTHFRNRMSACFEVSKPVWVTELAEHGYANDPDSLAQQARYVIQGYARGLAAGAENITWYALVTINDSYEQGLLFDDFTPKPAFYAYKTLTAELTAYTYARTLSVPAVEGYVFASPCGQEKTVAWGSGTLTFEAVQLRVVDRQGDVTFVVDGGAGDVDGATNSAIRLQLTADPVFVAVSG
jgi:hypothetical protein